MSDPSEIAERARIVVRDAGFSVRSIARVPEGRAHHVFRAVTLDGTVFVKLSGSPRPRFSNEAAALRALESHTISAPRLCAHGDDFLISYSIGEELRSIGPQDVEAWGELGAWMHRLHSIDAAGLGLRYDTDPLDLGQRLARSLDRSSKGLPDSFKEFVEPTLEVLSRSTFSAQFIHRDLRADNILVERETGRLAGVVDFEHAAKGPPAWDLVKTIHWNQRSQESAEAFQSAYGEMPGQLSIFRQFEALMVLSNATQRRLYGDWASRVLKN